MPVITQIQLRGDTAANWTSADPILAAREIGIETDTNSIKIGDGTTAWSSLPYFGSGGDVSKVGTPVNNQIGVWTGDGTIEGDANLTFDTSTDTLTTVNIAASGTVGGSNLSGTNTGDQTTIVGITGTKAQFDTAVTDGNFLYVGDVTQYTDGMADIRAAAAIATHELAADPHPQYLTSTEGNATYQPLDADLTTWAGLTPSANFQTLVTQTFAQMRTSLDLEAGTDFYSIAAADAAFQPLDPFLTDIASLTDPGADRILFWDDSAGQIVFLTLGTNLSITGTTLDAAGASVSDGDYGDITITSGVWEIDDGTVAWSTLEDALKVLIGIAVPLTSDLTTSSTSFVDATGCSFTADADTTYLVELHGTFQSAATTTGIGVGLKIPSGAITGAAFPHLAATTNAHIQQRADDAILGNSTGVATANANNPVYGWWLVRIEGTGGTVQLRWRSEVAASTTLKAPAAGQAGTYIRYKKIA